MKNVTLEQKMTKSRNKCHFVENKTDIMQHDLKLHQTSSLPKYTGSDSE